MDGLLMEFKHLARRIEPPEGLIPENWAQHPNGGGWVENTATVALTAFVGPDAIVMEEARVIDTARIEGQALISGNSLVADESVVTDRARVTGTARILGKSRLEGNVDVRGYAVLVDQVRDKGFISPRSNQDRIRCMRIPLQRNAL